MNRSKKYCVLHNGMITWNYLPDVFKLIKSAYPFHCSRARYEILSRKILGNIDAGRHYDSIFSDMHASAVFQV